MTATASHLAQVAKQLARWHDNATEGVEHRGEDESGDGNATGTAANELRQAAKSLADAADHVASAHNANGGVRWIPHANTAQ